MTKMMERFLVVTFLVLQSNGAAGAQTEPAMPALKLTLQQAIQMALTKHPSLVRIQESIRAAEARTAQAKSAYYPQISASGLAKQGLSGASGALGLRGLVTSPLFRDLGASSAILQNLYDFGRTAHDVKAGQWISESLNHVLEAQRAVVILEVHRAYYGVLEQQRLIKIAEETLAERRLTVRQATAFYKAELKSKVDLTLAEVGETSANLELVQTRNRLQTAFAELHRAMGLEAGSVYTLDEPAISIGSPPDLDPSLLESQERRPDLLGMDAQIRAEEEMVARAERNRWPRLMALFSSGWLRFSELSPGRLLLGAFGVDFPIFTGGRIKNEIVEAKARLAETQAAREELSQEIRLQAERAHHELLTAIESIRANEPLVTQAREALRLAQIRYRVQLGSFVELAAADAAASAAEARYAQAFYKYKTAEAMLNYATGRSDKR